MFKHRIQTAFLAALVFFACMTPIAHAAAPVVMTDDATFIDGTGATLNAIVNPNGEATLAWFQYSVDPNFTNNSPKVYLNEVGSDTQAYNYSYRVSGLSSDTTFYYRVGAEQETSAPTYGQIVSFHTLPPNPPVPPGTPPPDVSTLAATDITSTSAVLHGSTNPHGFNAIAWFNYALDSAFQQGSNSALFEDQGAGTTDTNFSYTLTGLTPGTTYYYRAGSMHDDSDIRYGFFIQHFTTLLEGQVPFTDHHTTSTTDTGSNQPPTISGPVIEATGAIVTCTANCGYNELIQMMQRIIKFLIFDLSLPLSALIFMYAGWQLMTSGADEHKRGHAKKAFMAVFKGLVIALAAWLIINTILTSLLTQEAQQGGANLLQSVSQ